MNEQQTLLYDELWNRGIIAPWYLREHQLPLYEKLQTVSRDFLVFNISRRFGKSTTLAADAVERALNSRMHIDFATAYLTHLEKFIIPVFDNILSTCPEALRPTYLKSKKTYVFGNGSTIQLIGLDKNPNAIRGNAIDHLVVDEAAFVNNLEYLYKSVIIPATINRMFKIIFSSTPPEDSEHYFLELMQMAKKRDTYVCLTIEDNLSIGPRERERVLEASGGKYSATAQREYYCKVVRDARITVVPEFNTEGNTIMDITIPEFYFPQTTIDFGGSIDKAGIICGYYDFRRAVYVIKTSALVEANTGTKEVIAIANSLEVLTFGQSEQVDRVIDCFGQTRTDLNIMKFFSRPPMKEKGSVEANINQLRIAFQQKSIEIENNKYNQALIDTLVLGQWAGKDFKRSEKLGHLDLLAALSYAFREKNQTNPYPSWAVGKSMDKFDKKVAVVEKEIKHNPFL